MNINNNNNTANVIYGGDGNDTISLTAESIIGGVVISGKGANDITVKGDHFGTLQFDYSNADDFTGRDTDKITGFDTSDQFILPSGYSYDRTNSKADNGNFLVFISNGSDSFQIATLVGFQESLEDYNFTNFSPT